MTCNVFGETLNLAQSTMSDPSLTHTQLCALMKTVLFCETLLQQLRDSLRCKDCWVNTHERTYLLTCTHQGPDFQKILGKT